MHASIPDSLLNFSDLYFKRAPLHNQQHHTKDCHANESGSVLGNGATVIIACDGGVGGIRGNHRTGAAELPGIKRWICHDRIVDVRIRRQRHPGLPQRPGSRNSKASGGKRALQKKRCMPGDCHASCCISILACSRSRQKYTGNNQCIAPSLFAA